MATEADILLKQPGEERLYDFNCEPAGLRADETIETVIDLVFYKSADKGKTWTETNEIEGSGSAAISGKVLQDTIIGGIDNTLYKATFRFSTPLSPVVEADFLIMVKEM